jgi:hypothetical protein
MIPDSGDYARAKEKDEVNGDYKRFNKLKRQREVIPNRQSSLAYRAALVRHSTSNVTLAPTSSIKTLTALSSYGHPS